MRLICHGARQSHFSSTMRCAPGYSAYCSQKALNGSHISPLLGWNFTHLAQGYRSDSVGSLEEPSQVRSMDRMYSRGATLRVRLNNVLKAAGLSYPRSAAVSVTDAPAVSFGSAARMHACCRHATKLSPVSRRNNRVNVRRVRCSESAQSSIFAFAFGDAENLRQRRARALSVGNGRERGNS